MSTAASEIHSLDYCKYLSLNSWINERLLIYFSFSKLYKPFQFHFFNVSYKFQNNLVYIYKKSPPEISVGIELNLFINLERIDIFTVLSLPICEHAISFHLFQFSFISFISVVQLQHKNPAHALLDLDPNISFLVVINGIVFLILLFMCSLWVQRHIVALLCLCFYVCILQPCWTLTQTVMQSAIRNSFISLLLSYCTEQK